MTERVAPATRSDPPPRLLEETRPQADLADPMSGARAGADADPTARSAAPAPAPTMAPIMSPIMAPAIAPAIAPPMRAPAERAEVGKGEDVAALWERVCAFHDVSVVGGGLLADVQPIAIEGGRLRMARVPGASSSLAILGSRAERIAALIADAVGRRFRIEILEDPAPREAGDAADSAALAVDSRTVTAPGVPSVPGPLPSSRADGSRAEATVRALPAVRTAIEVFGAVVTDVSEADGPGAGATMAVNRS